MTDSPVEDVRKKCDDDAEVHGGERVEVDSIEDATLPASGGGDFIVRVYKPRSEAEKKLPAVLFIHGGGWVSHCVLVEMMRGRINSHLSASRTTDTKDRSKLLDSSRTTDTKTDQYTRKKTKAKGNISTFIFISASFFLSF